MIEKGFSVLHFQVWTRAIRLVSQEAVSLNEYIEQETKHRNLKKNTSKKLMQQCNLMRVAIKNKCTLIFFGLRFG